MGFNPKETIRTKNAIVQLNLTKLATMITPKKVATKAVQSDLQRKIRALSLDLVRVGKSPVKKRGRFKPYAAQRKDAVGDYPLRIKGKLIRPVNLILDKAKRPYLESLFEYRRIPGGIAFLEPVDEFLKILFDVHNEGARKDIPQRKVMPTNGDDYTAIIRKAIKNIYLKRIRGIIGSSG